MKKILMIFKEMKNLILRHKLYFLAPLFLTLLIVTILVIKLGPTLLVAFIYAGG